VDTSQISAEAVGEFYSELGFTNATKAGNNGGIVVIEKRLSKNVEIGLAAGKEGVAGKGEERARREEIGGEWEFSRGGKFFGAICIRRRWCTLADGNYLNDTGNKRKDGGKDCNAKDQIVVYLGRKNRLDIFAEKEDGKEEDKDKQENNRDYETADHG
jgi:hypothetical protein